MYGGGLTGNRTEQRGKVGKNRDYMEDRMMTGPHICINREHIHDIMSKKSQLELENYSE